MRIDNIIKLYRNFGRKCRPSRQKLYICPSFQKNDGKRAGSSCKKDLFELVQGMVFSNYGHLYGKYMEMKNTILNKMPFFLLKTY